VRGQRRLHEQALRRLVSLAAPAPAPALHSRPLRLDRRPAPRYPRTWDLVRPPPAATCPPPYAHPPPFSTPLSRAGAACARVPARTRRTTAPAGLCRTNATRTRATPSRSAPTRARSALRRPARCVAPPHTAPRPARARHTRARDMTYRPPRSRTLLFHRPYRGLHPAACGGCPLTCPALCVQACKDTNTTACAVWAMDDQCTLNPGHMNRVCPATCGVCTQVCEDKNDSCKAWAKEGGQQRNKTSPAEPHPTSPSLARFPAGASATT